MWKYYIALFFMLCVGFMSCGQSQEEKLEYALREVERLDAMRKKADEILKQQTSNLVLQTNEYNDWKMSQDAIILAKEADIVQIERNLAYWKNWHLSEAKRLKSVFDASESMLSWKRTLDDIKSRLEQATNDTMRYRRILHRNETSRYTSKHTRERYTRLLSNKRDSMATITAEIEAHKNNAPKPSYKRPQRRTDKISEWEKKVSDAKELYRVTVNEVNSIDTAKLQNLDKLRMDLMLTKASYDSINVLHTRAVGELSKK